ncbi:hypothetical protein NSP_38270 [Nodularia spumigena CCY9414]|nr:hypothetical protein NSP_38270 [Nodularia spumigena CCY9414]
MTNDTTKVATAKSFVWRVNSVHQLAIASRIVFKGASIFNKVVSNFAYSTQQLKN